MSNSLFKKQDYVFLSVVFIAFYFINSLYMQVHDDVTYTFFNGARNVSWTDAIVANAYDYLHVNGRFIVHTFVRWMCGGHRVHFYALGCAFSLCLLLASSLAIIRRKVHSADPALRAYAAVQHDVYGQHGRSCQLSVDRSAGHGLHACSRRGQG